MVGVFSLTSWVREPDINPGDEIEIHIFITGHGEVPSTNKLNVSNPSSILEVDDEGKVGIIQTCIIVQENSEKIVVGIATGNNALTDSSTDEKVPAIQQFPIPITGGTLALSKGYFLSQLFISQLMGKEVVETDKRSLGESTWDSHPPILLKLKSSSNAPPGDHVFILSLFYGDNNNVNMSQKEVSIHIRSWTEIHQKLLQRIAVFLGSIALISGIIQTVYTVLQYYKVNVH